MDLLNDYLHYNSGNECPRSFHLWSCLSMMAAVSSRRVSYKDGGENAYGQLELHPALYICLVGPQGSRKSFAKDCVRNILVQHFSDIAISANVETREAICQFLGSEQALRVFTDANGCAVEERPYFLIINELVNFLSVNPAAMVNFLVDIYKEKYYDVRTKNKGSDYILNPCINVLACATTEFVADQLRSRILSGGLSRRMIFINELKDYERIPSPRIPEGGNEALARVIAHLHKIRTITGVYEWESPEARECYNDWYRKLQHPIDPLMAGFYRSKHEQVLRITMLLDLASYTPTLKMRKDYFEVAAAIVLNIEEGMKDLFICAGRNELAGPQQRLLQIIERHGGAMPEKLLLREDKDLNPIELQNVLMHLKKQGQLHQVIYEGRVVYMSEARYNAEKEKGNLGNGK